MNRALSRPVLAAVVLAAAALAAVLGVVPSCRSGSGLPPLVPRAILLEESERGNPALSPDGTLIAYCAPYHGVQNIWVRSADKADDRAVTDVREGGIDVCSWQADGRHVLYFKDEAGDENTHLFQTDIGTLETRDLTPIAGARARALIADDGFPDTVLIHINARDKRYFDLYHLDLRTGSLRLDTENPGDVDRFYADHRLRARAADVTKPDNSAEVRVRDDAGAPWRTVLSWGADEMNSDLTGLVGFSADDAKVLVVTSLGANAERLIEVDPGTGAWKVLSADPRFDVTNVMIDPVRHSLEAVGYEGERTSWVFFDRATRADFESLRRVHEGDIRIRGRDRADRTWLVKYAATDAPTTYYRFDRATGKATYLFSEDPKLEGVRLAPKSPVRFKARDGLELYGYLTVPPGIPARGLPLVVMVHGGPWMRDTWELDFPVQLLANRGYAVLQVNFRGSTGYGKAYQNAGDLELGGKAIEDLVDGKAWAVARGLAAADRVAVMGGSYGGYATLAALAFHPGEFRCGVAINAMSDANLFMATMPPYWTVGRARWEARLGKDPDFLSRISPLSRADMITSPLLLIHNANDVRVTKEHSDRMAAALRERGKDVTYLLFPGAGHLSGGIPVNLLRRWAAIEAFLAKHLGGRAEPPAEDEKWDSVLR
jgi:dipeptidyl aminopeptidase/acylaminoacyl peptidase